MQIIQLQIKTLVEKYVDSTVVPLLETRSRVFSLLYTLNITRNLKTATWRGKEEWLGLPEKRKTHSEFPEVSFIPKRSKIGVGKVGDQNTTKGTDKNMF